MVPCYIDMFYPHVGIATLELLRVFGSFDCVVTPSGSCTHHIRNKFTAAADSPEKQNLIRNTYDLVEFLHDVLKIRESRGRHSSIRLHCTPVALRFVD
jgi:L-lactate dehydrogenase complex protein LldE